MQPPKDTRPDVLSRQRGNQTALRASLMCPLPKGYRWEVLLLQKLNSAHLTLHYGRLRAVTQLTSTCAVLDMFDKPIDDVAQQIIDRSYRLWEEYSTVPEDKQAWKEKAAQLSDRLGTKVKVEVVRK